MVFVVVLLVLAATAADAAAVLAEEEAVVTRVKADAGEAPAGTRSVFTVTAFEARSVLRR